MVARFFTLAVVLSSVATALANISIATWSSSRSTALDALPSKVKSSKFLDHVLNHDQICDFDAVVLIDQPGAHRPPASHIARSMNLAPSAHSFKVSGSIDWPRNAENLASRCGARLLNYSPGPSSSGDVSLEEGRKHVLCLKMPQGQQTSDMEKIESSLAAELDTIASVFPSHFIIYRGPEISNIQARQSISRPTIDVTNSSQQPVTTSTQDITVFFTTGLVTALLLVFFILLPALMMGIGALSSIQTPTRMDAPKGYNAVERKKQ